MSFVLLKHTHNFKWGERKTERDKSVILIWILNSVRDEVKARNQLHLNNANMLNAELMFRRNKQAPICKLCVYVFACVYTHEYVAEVFFPCFFLTFWNDLTTISLLYTRRFTKSLLKSVYRLYSRCYLSLFLSLALSYPCSLAGN